MNSSSNSSPSNNPSTTTAGNIDSAELSDRAAILQLAYGYASAVDRQNFDQMKSLFTADASLLVPHLNLDMQGIDNIIASILPITNMFDRTQHSVFNQTIQFNDDRSTASAETYCLANHIYKDENGIERKMDMGIRYQESLSKTNNQWRFDKRILILDWQQDLPLKG